MLRFFTFVVVVIVVCFVWLTAASEDSSELVFDDFCEDPPVFPAASCGAQEKQTLWTYNSNEQRCEKYVYQGCGRTRNLFKTEKECRNNCDPASGNVLLRMT